MHPDPTVMKAMMAGFQGEPRDMEKTGPDGSRVVMRKGTTAEIERTLEHFAQDGTLVLRMIFFHPSEVRLESYPSDMPFVPDRPVVAGGGSDGEELVVWTNGSPDEFNEILAECNNDGWVADSESGDAGAALLRTVVMRWGEAVRNLSHVPVPTINMVILTEDDHAARG